MLEVQFFKLNYFPLVRLIMSLYASRDGALYQSYDDFAGSQGFYDSAEPTQPFDPVIYLNENKRLVPM